MADLAYGNMAVTSSCDLSLCESMLVGRYRGRPGSNTAFSKHAHYEEIRMDNS